MFTIHLSKEPFKFSCSHFTILSPKHAERLHGHNYQLRIDLIIEKLDESLGFAFDFNEVKPKIRMICDELDEKILLPQNSPYLKLKDNEGQTEVQFGPKFYSFPISDCLKLPVKNVTSEELARYCADRLCTLIKDLPHWRTLRAEVEETRGQSVSYTVSRP